MTGPVRSMRVEGDSIRVGNDSFKVFAERDPSPRWKEIVGASDGEMGTDPAAWLARIHPDDLPHVKASLAAAVGSDFELMAELRTAWPDRNIEARIELREAEKWRVP